MSVGKHIHTLLHKDTHTQCIFFSLTLQTHKLDHLIITLVNGSSAVLSWSHLNFEKNELINFKHVCIYSFTCECAIYIGTHRCGDQS